MLSDLPSLTYPDPVNNQLILRTDAHKGYRRRLIEIQDRY